MAKKADLRNIENKVKVHTIFIEELDGDIFVKDATLTKMEQIQKADQNNYARTVLFQLLCEEDGTQYFKRVQELNEFIEKLPMNVVATIMEKITEVVFPKKSVEEDAKN